MALLALLSVLLTQPSLLLTQPSLFLSPLLTRLFAASHPALTALLTLPSVCF